jgi:uncharacterized protein (TIGR02118 family)
MVKVIFCLKRRSDVSAEEFSRYWREEHGPLVRARAATLGIRRYIQCRPVLGPAASSLAAVRGSVERFDGVAELWFDDIGAIAGEGLDAAGRRAARALLEDEATFIDLPNSPIWVYEEEELA